MDGTGQNQNKGEPAKMTLGIDARSNSLIVAAPDPLFQEVKTLVTQLDHAAETNHDESMKVVTLKQTNPQLIQRAVTAMVGNQIKTTTIGRPAGGMMGMGRQESAAPERQPLATISFQSPSDQNVDQTRQRMDFFNQLQRQGGGLAVGAVDADGAAAVDKSKFIYVPIIKN